MKIGISNWARPFASAWRVLAFTLVVCATGGAWADFAKTNPVTGETENYTWKFVGTDTWNGTGYWQDSSGANPSGVPGKQGESTFDPFLFDGNTININAGMAVDGWTLRMGLYNGAYVSMNNLKKFQSGTMWVTVDETSKVRINNVNDKYEGDALNLYSAREAGIEWTCALSGAQGTGLPFNYYLKGNGSVAFTTITAANCSHTIKQADVTLHGTTATGKGKRVNSKTLVSFTSSTQSFLADATIKVKYANGASCKDVALSSVTATTPTLTTAGDIGDCELVQTSTGIVLYYVDYVYTPSISLNFTDSGANLTTENDVGLAGYTAPGTAWNNIAAAVDTTSSTIKMIDATGTATVNSGISVQIATTRGSWNCSSLTAATDPRQGYIDEDSGDNTTPTITVSGIPFNNYRVIVYHATDNGDVKFGYDTINGTNLTYVDGALTTGTTAWGDTGDQNTSHPMEEGVNTLVSGVLSGSTATIVAHRGSGFRGCVAAVQIVEASNTSLEETGGYAADCSQIVFKNTTLAELTGDTLSARFGGEWAGAVKTSKLTFNNFDRSAEASGTITCEAQVQHDSNVKGVLLTFTQVGDDVAVKTTGAKYLAGTVGTSVASGTDASGYYAAYNFALPRTPQTGATVVWEPGEFEMTKVGSDGNSYSFSSFGGLSVNGDGNLVVDTANAQGAIINLPDTSKTAVSVLIKYSNLAAESGGNATLANCAINSGNNTYYLGARTITKGTLPLTAYYAGNAYAFNDATYGHGNVPSMDTGSGYFLFAHGSSNGTYAYSGETIGALDGGYNTQLKLGGYNITKVSIGGGFENNRAYCWKGNGTVIERVAIFLGSIKTPGDLSDYYFPSAVAKDYEKWEYAKGMVTWNTTANSNNELAGSNSQYTLFDLQSGVDTSTTYGGTSSYQIFDSTKSATFWNYLSNGSVSDGVYQSPGVALRFSGTSATKTIGGTFGPVTLGGMYVERGAEGYSFQQAGHSRRSTILGSANSDDETWFKFEEPFELRRTGTLCLSGNINIELPEATDVLTLNANADNGNANYAPNVVATVTGLSNDGNVYIGTHTTAGGTLRMHGAGHIAAAKLVASGATLDFSDIGSRYNDATPFINCPLTIDSDTKFVFPEDIVLPYTYKVATSITYTGTPAAEYTDDNGNVYTLPLTIDTVNGTVTVPALTSATVIEVNGALTITAATTADIVVNSTGVLTLATGGSLSGTVTGSGTIVCNQGVDLSGSGFDDSTNWTGKVQLTGDAVPTTYLNETVYGNANSTLEVVSGHVYMTAVTSLPGTVNVANGATLYVANTGLTSLSISGTNSGTINLQTATSLATLTLSDGIARGSLAYPNSLTTLNVALTETIADDGEASFTCGSATLTSGTLTLTRAGGTTDAPIAGTIDGSTVSFAWTPAVSGKACWIDYEMNYKSGVTTGFENSGSDTTDLHSDSGITDDDAFYNGMLYTYAHPWRDMTGDNAYPSSWTAVVRCTVPNYENAAIITFGTCNGGLIGLVAGADPETQMKLVKTTGNSAFTVLQTMTVQNATTAQHVYVFEVENNTTIKVYCDGDEVLNETFAAFTLGGGIQVGSVHGGIGNTGIIRFAKNESPANTLDETVQKNARIDCVRLFKGLLGTKAIRQLSVEFPAVKLYRATVAADDTTTWDDLDWSPEWDGGNEYSKIILTAEGDATLTLPSEIVAEEFVINITAGKTLTLNKAAGGTTFTTTEPIEVNAGSIYLANETSLGDWQISGTGTVRLPDGLEITGALTGAAKITVVSGDVVTVTSTGSIANTVVGDGRIVFEGALPSDTLMTSLQDENNWTGTVEIKDYTETAGTHKIIVLTNYGNGSSTVALNGVTSTMFANTSASSGNYPDVTLKEIEIGEGGWTDNDNLTYGVNMLYKADLTGSGTITVKTSGTGTIQFVGGNHTFNGSVVFGDSTGKQVAFMQSSSDTIPDGTAKSIVVAGGVNMSIASGKSWTAPGGIYVLGTLKVEGTGVANGGVTTQSGATIDLSTFQGETPAISGALTLNGGIIKLPAGTELPYQIAGSGNGAPSSCTIGEDSSRTDVLLKNGQLVATRTATISSESVVTFGSIGWTGTGNDYTLTLSAPTYLTFDSTTVDYLKIYVENGGALHIKGDIPANTTILGLTSLQIASGDTERFKSGYTRLYSQIGNTESGNDALNAGGTISVSSDEAIPAGNYTLARWITPQKMSSGYGHVATLVTTGLADGLTAELVYCVDRIMLRVYNTEEQAAKGTIKVWPYGDSITEGFNAGSTKANYRVLLAQKLSLLGFNVEMVGCYDKINGANGIDPSGQEITNAWKWHSAKHGATAGPTTSAAGRANLCENVDTLCAQAGNPDVVLLLAGANDIVPATGLTAQQVVNSITNIVAHLATNLPDTKIVVGNQIGVEEGYTPGNYNYVVSMIPQVNALLKTYVDNLPAELNGKVFLADLNSYVKSGEYAVLYGGDHLHPDWWGHDQMAEGWLSVITNKFTATQVFPSATVPAAPANDELGAAAKSELAAYRKGFKLARRIDAASNLNTAAPYAATGNGATEGIQKVAYFVEYVRDDNNAHKWVWVDMDAFGDCDLATIGLPATNHQQVVTKLHVKSNHNGIDDVAADDDSVTGFIEFSPFDYNGNVSGVSGAPAGNASCCDWNDTLSDSGTYGCMQVHRVFSPAKSAADGVTRGGQVLFAYNNWRSSTSTAEFGIGNFSSHFYRGANDAQSLDYTYTSGATKMNADAYSVKRIEIWTKKVYGTIFSVW